MLLLPELLRNIHSFAALTLPIAGQRQLVGTFKPSYILVNGLKNYAFNFPTVYIEKSGHYAAALVYRIAGLLNVAIDAPEISEDGRAFALHGFRTYGHDTAVNDVIAWCFLFCLVWTVYRMRDQRKQKGGLYVISAAAAFVLLCCVVRWEPFVSRYMLPYLAMLCPAIAYAVKDFRDYFGREKIASWPEAIILFMCCVDLIGLTDFHRQISYSGKEDRLRGYFYHQNDLYDDYKEVCGLLSDKTGNIGLILGGDTYEYPLWQQLKDSDVQLRHIMVQNESAQYEEADFNPEWIISSFVFEKGLEYHGEKYDLQEECKDNSYLWIYQIE